MASFDQAHRAAAIPARILIALIDVYRFLLSPWLGRQCRFEPSCSVYARDAILAYGALHGCWLALCRIGRCHPWAEGGLDPVPRAADGRCTHHQQSSG